MSMLEIADAVAELLGADQVTRYRTEPHLGRGQCWECEQQVDAAHDRVSVLVLQPEITVGTVDLTGMFNLSTLAHSACAGSGVRRLTHAQTQAKAAALAAAGVDLEASTTDVTAVAAVWPSGTDSAYPYVLISFGDLSSATDSGERRDVIAEHLLGAGWHLISRMGQAPPAGPAGWWLRFAHERGNAEAPGRLTLTDPAGRQWADIPVLQPGRYWRPGVLRSGRTVLYVAPLKLAEWTSGYDYPAIQRAVKAGLMVGGTIPVELDGPGNDIA